MVFYRKYRPQKISELDLVQVQEKLSSILKNNIPHALLFTGPKGLGKTSSARIFAKAINCTKKGKDNEPCNSCDDCISITNGSNMDVLEIDAASNRGIDEIRDLRDRVKFAPSGLTYKVYIIDEVHMLTTEAFNALLKTLEEPPSHVVFILCTTELHKVPQTILSRTFHVDFKKPTTDEIKKSLSRIVEGEKLKVDDEVLTQIAKISDGAFRDAAKIFEELVFAADGKKITSEVFESLYHADSLTSFIQRLIDALSQKNAKDALLTTQQMRESNVDFKEVMKQLLEKLHGYLLSNNGIGNDKSAIASPDLEKLISIALENYKTIAFTPIESLPLELTILRFCEDSKKMVVETKVEVVKIEPIKAEPVRVEPIKEVEKVKEVEVVQEAPKVEDAKEETDPKAPRDLFAQGSKSTNFFQELIARVKHENNTIAGVLRGCILVSANDEEVVLQTKFKFHKEKLSEPKTMVLLEKCASEILAKSVKMIINLKT